jgi:hypothetical protein
MLLGHCGTIPAPFVRREATKFGVAAST